MKVWVSLILLMTFCLGCNKNKDVALSLDESIKIRMYENIDSTTGERTMTLNCFTEKIYVCANYYIANSFAVAGNTITINFTQIVAPNICLESPAPASALINLGTLAGKNYDLQFNIGDTTINGHLNVTAEAYTATIPLQTKIEFVNSDLKRIPDNTINGIIGYASDTDSISVQSFIDSLQVLGAVPAINMPGEYGSFQVQPNGQIAQIQEPGYYFTRRFMFNYSGGSQPLKTLVGNYGLAYPDLTITLNTSKGEIFYSWQP